MRKNILITSIILGIILFTSSCKSKESAYKAAYERAKAKEVSTEYVIDDEVIVYTPPVKTTPPPSVSTTPSYPNETTSVVSPPSYPDETTKVEKVTAVDKNESGMLKRYSVVIYSFKNKTNATAAKEEMLKYGYNAIVIQNDAGMYRVIIAGYDEKASAIAKRNEVKTKYAPRFNDIWILEKR